MLERLSEYPLPIIIVDDGSDSNCKQLLNELADQFPNVELIVRRTNGGKGRAVKDGLLAAFDQGYSHAFQIDADGQHDLGDVQRFLEAAKNRPEAMIYGIPKFDESVPKHRKIARYLSHVWVWINTLSFEIEDSMCGFRIYPLLPSCELIDQQFLGDRMDFDTEVLVRLYWLGLELIPLRTRVNYPEGGVSHFTLFQDNVCITRMHARLFFSMLAQLPQWLSHGYTRLREKGR